MRLSCLSCRRIGKTGSAFEKFRDLPHPRRSSPPTNEFLRIQRNSKVPFSPRHIQGTPYTSKKKKKKKRKKKYKTRDSEDPFLLEETLAWGWKGHKESWSS
ncbi:hypothetical protein CEXT_320531 [Caerostris extrusa]|uniref:Uncharacterized protein n=1 Tax=Caerostris extrusa TaxID=172846 RepID=A0AAV4WHG5_CAEEX|nr:hypothetical protein CEXT_320531 [Caerostris extrusa]